jgi:hypothetical protein
VSARQAPSASSYKTALIDEPFVRRCYEKDSGDVQTNLPKLRVLYFTIIHIFRQYCDKQTQN